MNQALRPIRSDDELEKALARISALLDATPGSARADELEVLSVLVESFEAKRYRVRPADPIDMLLFLMDQHGLRAKDLVDVFGSSGRTSEILAKQRPLTLPMIRKLSARFRMPADSFIAEYECASD
tara:strand:- start:69 stop:446 length:378 start_codon:yes stop_codon:yes gene_type:complete